MGEIAAAYEANNPGVRVVLNFGGSSALATQILEGGGADLYAPADRDQMQRLAAAGLLAGEPHIFASNRLVIIVPADDPSDIRSLADLARPGLQLLLATPGVPVRTYSDQLLAALAADPAYGADYAAAVYANLVSEEENVRQVAAKIALGEADVGVVYATDVTPEIAGDVRQIPVPEAYGIRAVYPIARVVGGGQPDHAAAFIRFVLDPAGQAILARWGFGPPPP